MTTATKSFAKGLGAALALAAAMGCGGLAQAQLVIGQTAGFTGPVAAGVKETSEGAKLYIDAVNARGGVFGQAIQLESMDDQFDAKLAVENAKTLITKKNVLALFLTRGTPQAQALLPLLREHHVPLVAPSTGAMVLHKPVNPYVFNVRSSYQREAERVIRHLSLIGLTRVAVLQTDDSFGADVVMGAQAGFDATGKKPLFIEKFDRAKPGFEAIAARVTKTDAQAVLFIASGQVVADGMKVIREAGSKAQLVTLSNNASTGFVKQLGDNARGAIITQVFPFERSLASPIVKEAIGMATAKGLPGVTPAMMEGFAAAKVLVEGLKRAGPKPTREKLVAGLNAISKLDIGGMELSFSATDHTGLDFVDLSIIGPDGKFMR